MKHVNYNEFERSSTYVAYSNATHYKLKGSIPAIIGPPQSSIADILLMSFLEYSNLDVKLIAAFTNTRACDRLVRRLSINPRRGLNVPD